MDNEIGGFGAIESPKDYRNVPLGMVASAVPLPEEYTTDISKLTIWHQKKNGSCVGHAFAKLTQYYFYKKTGKVLPFSPRFLYALAKCRDGYSGEGTYPSIVAKILNKVGCATEKTCINDSDLKHEEYVFFRQESNISPEAFAEAANYKIPGYAFIKTSDPEEIKRAIYEGGMFAGLLKIGKEWYTDKNGKRSWNKKDILPLQHPAETISGHEVAIYGWEKDSIHFLSNSWSKDWADDGNGYFSMKEYQPFFIEGIVIKELPLPIIDETKRLPAKPQCQFSNNLDYGMRNSNDVRMLQDCLKYEELMPAYIPSTGNYLEETRKSVLNFQKKYNLINIYQEIVYAGRHCHTITRNKLNELYK